MEFALPQNLKQQLVSYDPVLKKERTIQRREGTATKKSTHPLGNLIGLIPNHIVSAKKQEQMVLNINQQLAAERWQVVTVPVAVNKSVCNVKEGVVVTENKHRAIMYHYEGMWVACWLPNPDEDYFYGFSIAFKDDRKSVDCFNKLNIPDRDSHELQFQTKKFGRSHFNFFSTVVTKEKIENGKFHSYYWNPLGAASYYKKSGEIVRRCINPFKEEVSKKVPRWSDSSDMWEKISGKYSTIAKMLKEHDYNFKCIDISDDWELTVDNVLAAYKKYYLNTRSHYNNTIKQTETLLLAANLNDRVQKVLNTPFFRNWIHSQCLKTLKNFENTSIDKKATIVADVQLVGRIYNWLLTILKVWPNTPVDYFRTNLEMLLRTPENSFSSYRQTQKVYEWLNKNMPVESFFQIFSKHYEKEMELKGNYHRQQISINTLYKISSLYNFRDAVDMLSKVLDTGKDLEPPRRWRIEEFHDYVQGESWKISNEKIDLPQDLFPTPINVQRGEERWTFFQPIDTHQLASWGQAVRNCVGSSGSYAEGVKKKQHFLVLCMIDKKPRFTVQLRVNNGLMSVQQVTDISNSRLQEAQREAYMEAFSKALQERENSLTSQT